MTVIVWDGQILAADRQSSNNGQKRSVTKIRKIGDSLYGISGSFDRGMAVFRWIEDGKKPEEWPEFQRKEEDYVYLVEITANKEILKYEREPWPMLIEEPCYAQGCGRDYAMGAIYMGANAVEAVKAACEFDMSCGMGIDVLALDAESLAFVPSKQVLQQANNVFSIGQAGSL